MATPDEQATEQAEHTERALQDSNPFETNGVGFQGATAFEQGRGWNIGQDYTGITRGIEELGLAMGVESQDVGAMTDAMQGLTSDGTPFFGNQPAYEVTGFDSMRGIAPIPPLNPQPTADGRIQPDSDFTFPEPAE